MKLPVDTWMLDEYVKLVEEDDQLKERLVKVLIAWNACSMILEKPIDFRCQRFSLLTVDTIVTWADLPEVLSLKFPEWEFANSKALKAFINARLYDGSVVSYRKNSGWYQEYAPTEESAIRERKCDGSLPFDVGAILIVQRA